MKQKMSCFTFPVDSFLSTSFRALQAAKVRQEVSDTGELLARYLRVVISPFSHFTRGVLGMFQCILFWSQKKSDTCHRVRERERRVL